MAEPNHKHDVLAPADLQGFLKEHWPTASSLTMALAEKGKALPPNTVANWYRPRFRDMSALSLIRVLVWLNAERKFYDWMRGLRGSPRAKPGAAIRVTVSAAEQGEKGAS